MSILSLISQAIAPQVAQTAPELEESKGTIFVDRDRPVPTMSDPSGS